MAWLVIETDTTVEVIPDFGPTHLLESTCWCPFRVEHYDRNLIIHEVVN